MKTFALTVVVSTLLAVALLAGGSPNASAQENVCETNPDPVDAVDPSVVVDEPVANDSVTSPLHVSGQARVFEATVSLTLFDADGTEIASTVTNAVEAGTLSPFSTDIPFSVTEDTAACLWVFEASAKDGSPTNVVQVPLTLEPTSATATATEPTPTAQSAQLPDTGSGAPGSRNEPIFVVVSLLALAFVLAITAGYVRAGQRQQR